MKHSAGIVLWRVAEPDPEAGLDATTIDLLLAHPGGPFWAKKDEHAWSIPKGEFDPDHEQPWDAARREFEEELGVAPPSADVVTIPAFRAGNKMLHAFAVEGAFDPASISSRDRHRSVVEIVWPPRSKETVGFPEVDRVAWIELDRCPAKLHKGQAPLVPALSQLLRDGVIGPA